MQADVLQEGPARDQTVLWLLGSLCNLYRVPFDPKLIEQRQRIAIARALLKRPKILIFDEAVSNLDQHTAEHFAKTINKLKGQVTMLFITHQIPRGLMVNGQTFLRLSIQGPDGGMWVKDWGAGQLGIELKGAPPITLQPPVREVVGAQGTLYGGDGRPGGKRLAPANGEFLEVAA